MCKACPERMVIQIVASNFDDFRYYWNLIYIMKGLQKDEVKFIGEVDNYAPTAFVFNKARVYDFTCTAKATIRDKMTTHLLHPDVLPGLKEVEGHERIKEPFDCLFNYQGYKTRLEQANSTRDESVKMLIFNDANGNKAKQYVAHVTFSCNSHRANHQYTVYATLTCQRFSYFPLQEDDFEAVLQALQNLHVDDE